MIYLTCKRLSVAFLEHLRITQPPLGVCGVGHVCAIGRVSGMGPAAWAWCPVVCWAGEGVARFENPWRHKFIFTRSKHPAKPAKPQFLYFGL